MSAAAAAVLLATSMKLAASHTAYPDGAPPGFSGGFKEDSCHACHFHQDLNASPGRVTLDGVPAKYEAGTRYSLTISLTRADMKLAGFQFTARFKDGGAQAGTVSTTSQDAARVAITTDRAIQYVGQNKTGSVLIEPGVATWTIDWTAPASGGAVVFTVAANAADGDGTAAGDFIYTIAAESPPP